MDEAQTPTYSIDPQSQKEVYIEVHIIFPNANRGTYIHRREFRAFPSPNRGVDEESRNFFKSR